MKNSKPLLAALLCLVLWLLPFSAHAAGSEPIRIAFLDSGVSLKHLDAAQVELNRRCAPRRDAAPAEDTPEPVRYALEAIAERFAQTLSLRDLAQEQGLTCAYLGQLISRSTGKGFARLLLEKRMHAARQLLMDDVSVGETARRCGIGDVSYFSQLYRRFFGENPSHHRRGQKRGAAPC